MDTKKLEMLANLMDNKDFMVSFIPIVGTLIETIMDVADGSLKGAGNITARFGLSIVTGLFDAVTEIASCGLASIVRGALTAGIRTVTEKALVYVGIRGLATGSYEVVKMATK